tara:strand:- start:1903 stop:2952 length:1050 start_codon:yes stop_codon:yes gene_type:complete
MIGFSEDLLNWYDINKRDLPWRNTSNAYYIWISEIILQQTKVVQAIPYYFKFISCYPNIEDLANADQDDVLKLWEGLGYYSRARNLHYTAKYIVDNYKGEFPRHYQNLLSLKGVGPYTAAAIASFAFNLPYAVLDGNVIRFLSRFYGISVNANTNKGKKEFQKLAQNILDKEKPNKYNQAIMEFGALQCRPVAIPNCDICPMINSCFAFNKNQIKDFPVKSKKTKIRIRYLHFFIINTNDCIYIKRRDKGIWNGLYEFPFIEFKEDFSISMIKESDVFKNFFDNSIFNINLISIEYKHKLSHQIIFARFWHINSNSFINQDYIKVNQKEVLNYPFPTLILNYLNSRNIK